ncbi:putative signal transduction histidine kinase [Candidatus Moduliflexus flocculans]|uniref:Putative signal transduction histidine kinase n=1 Tax=Candidatus Moduliflexus flocculans TaxID=1499966 RepID=A0A081BPP3_9BACT|nr:putative signal transduction histidine kinase [Candidatus Moduliflexus flocculans]
MAKLLNGDIQLKSVEGQGSVFTLYLPERLEPIPAAAPAAVAPQTVRPPAQTLVSKPPAASTPLFKSNEIHDDRHDLEQAEERLLLIIEDDAKFAKILFDMARERGFKGLIAGDGSAGLQLADQYHPNAIILDIGLPDLDGWKVMEKLKTNPETRHIPVHFISGQDASLEAMKMGAIGYITKPVTVHNLQEVFQKIEEILKHTEKSLLIVEDNETMRTSLCELLSGNDIRITAAASGEEAYRFLQEGSFDCVVLDLGLTDISGFDLLEKIKRDANLMALPIIVYTGKELTKDEELRLQKHAESIIIKGVKSPERLLDEVTLFLHRLEADLPHHLQKKIRMLHDKEDVFDKKIILVVDDDMRNVFALSSVLEGKGMEVLIAENGKEALDQLDAHPEINLVLMDIMMPEMNGYETMERIRSQAKFEKLPMIALTAKAMKGDRQKALDAGANDYLSKPIDIDKLLSLLRVWLY